MSIRIALGQVNVTVGDLEGNGALVRSVIEEARGAGVDLVALPELVITGYPPEDLVLKPSFISGNLRVLEEIATMSRGTAALVGFIDSDDKRIYNAAALIAGGEVRGVYHKHRLPNYGVFDEERYFSPGESILLARVAGTLIGITICEDIWHRDGPHVAYAAAGAEVIVNINGSPYHRGKGAERLDLLSRRATETGAAIAYVNMVGGQDELVFDGQSMAVDAEGTLMARAAQFETELLTFDLAMRDPAPGSSQTDPAIVEIGTGSTHRKEQLDPRIASEFDDTGEVYSALVLGVRDYLRKNEFEEALVGLSGGIDSSLTATIAADALGPVSVLGVLNPGEFTSAQSGEYAWKLAQNLGIGTINIPIDEIYHAYLRGLKEAFAGTGWNVAEENLQSRIRGAIWMAISNKSEALGRRRLVLSTGNKSELATGYATLYGDMAGGFSVLKDVPKTLVYELARWRNRGREVIPPEVLSRPPSAELRPDQLDTDSLPPYEMLDPILEAYIEDDKSVDEMAEAGMDRATVERVVGLVDRAEYKRRQAAPGIKVTTKAFGRDRRLPITNRYGAPRNS